MKNDERKKGEGFGEREPAKSCENECYLQAIYLTQTPLSNSTLLGVKPSLVS